MCAGVSPTASRLHATDSQFAGHGMSRIFACARGYADTLKTGKWDEKLLPKLFELTQERLEKTAKAQADFEAQHGKNVQAVHGKLVNSDKAVKQVDEAAQMMKASDGDMGMDNIRSVMSSIAVKT